MKVLILSQHYWPESFRINEVAASLQRAGCEVSVLTGQPNYPDGKVFPGYRAFRAGREEHEGYTIHRVPLVPRGGGGALRLIANYLSFLASAVAIGPWLLRGRPFDVVFVYGTSPILQAIAGVAIKRLKGAALVTWVQDLWPESLEATGFVRNRLILDAVAGVVRWIYRCSDLVLVQSETFIEAVSSMAGGTPVELHPNPGELAFTDAAAPRIDGLALATGFNVVFAGNLGKVQALDTILDAAELCQGLPDTRFVLIGSGSRADWLRREVERRGLRNVQVPGRFAPAEMPAILAQASALLVSLVRSPIMSRTVPSKIQAYFAAGRPVIAALDGEGARIVTEAGAGLACPAEDAGALAAAVRALRAQTPEALRQAGDAGRRYYERHFDPGVLAHRLVHRFQELVSASSRCVRADHAEP